jgi:hypothetical protein
LKGILTLGARAVDYAGGNASAAGSRRRPAPGRADVVIGDKITLTLEIQAMLD